MIEWLLAVGLGKVLVDGGALDFLLFWVLLTGVVSELGLNL